MTMYAPSRDEARQFLFDTWRKYQAGEALSPLERVVLDVVLMHPEYHAILQDSAHHAARDYGPESGQTNPFLHMHLHLAIEEQLSIDQPPGIRAEYERLRDARGDVHAAKHAMLECLGEVLWQSQRTGTPLDAGLYLECLRRQG
jgi:hypothetical protein